MTYTLGQARKRLQASIHAYGVLDVRDAVNRAVEALAGLSGWECLRQVVRISSAGPCFTLPQGAAGLVRACVNGKPTTVRGQDFRFMHSGPGDIDMSNPPFGFSTVPPRNILDLGFRPVMVEPERPFRIFAVSDGTDPQPDVTVRGVGPDGRYAEASVHVYGRRVTDDLGAVVSGCDPADAVVDDHAFQVVESVVLDDSCTDYFTLYAEDADTCDRFPVAVYHPEVKNPRFRRYSVPGIGPGQPVDLLVETRIAPLPLVRDSDQLPFEGIDPVEWMINYNWCMKAGEVDKAEKFKMQAVQWLKSNEVANDTVQTQVVINSVYENSMGEVSADAFNI